MLKIGLTGGIACGKSTVGSIIQKLGVPVLDADQVARDVVAVGSDGLNAIKSAFGADICLHDGQLNRIALRNVMLHNPEAKKELEDITHPRIFKAMIVWQQQQVALGHSVSLVEAALMVETGSYKMYDGVIVTSCSPELQCRRLMERNHVTEMEAKRWIESQFPLEEKEAIANWVIHNNGSLQSLQHTVVQKWPKFLTQIQVNSTS
jgi:dephospho-CoA kinase